MNGTIYNFERVVVVVVIVVVAIIIILFCVNILHNGLLDEFVFQPKYLIRASSFCTVLYIV